MTTHGRKQKCHGQMGNTATSAQHLYIGIDPDVTKSGVAAWEKDTKRFRMIESMYLGDLIGCLEDHKHEIAMVVIEAGWLNQGNRHTFKGQSIAAAAKTGQNVGRNHQRGMDIVEIVEWLRIPYKLAKPTTKNSWKNSEETFKKITGTKGGNPENRDAAMLVYNI